MYNYVHAISPRDSHETKLNRQLVYAHTYENLAIKGWTDHPLIGEINYTY